MFCFALSSVCTIFVSQITIMTMEKKRKYQAIIISITVLVVLAGIATAIYFGNSKEAKEEKPDKELVGIAEQGRKAYYEGDYINSLNSYLDFIHKAEQHPEVYGRYLVDAYFYIGIVYYYFNDEPNSNKYNQKAYEVAIRTKYYDHIIAIINNATARYGKEGNYAKASEWNDKLLDFKQIDSTSALCHYYWNRGNIKNETNQGGNPTSDWERAYRIIENDESKDDGKAVLLKEMASYHRSLGQDNLELKYLKKAFDMAVRSKKPHYQLLSTRAILDYYIRKDDERHSLEYGKTYLSLLDSSMSAKKFIEAKSAQEQYEQQKAEKNIQSLNITVSKQRLRSYIIIAAFIIALIIIAIIVYQNRKLQAAYRVLYKKNIEVMDNNKHDGKKDTDKNSANTAEGKSNDSASQPSEQLYARILKVMEDPHIYCDPDFSLSKLAEMLGSNVTYVSKAINEHYGQNVRSFVNSYRIGEACRKISNAEDYGNLTLQAIGLSVGYNTQVNFNRAFKQITGMTPSVFQKMAKEANDK